MVLSLIAEGGTPQLNRLGNTLQNIRQEATQNRLLNLQQDRQARQDQIQDRTLQLKENEIDRQFQVRSVAELSALNDDQLASGLERQISEGRRMGFNVNDHLENLNLVRQGNVAAVRNDINGAMRGLQATGEIQVPKSEGFTGTVSPDFIGTPVRVERDGRNYLAGMVQNPDGTFSTQEVPLDGELTDTSGRTPREQQEAKGRESALKIATQKSGEAFDKLEKIDANISNLQDAKAALDAGANTGKIANLLPTLRSSTLALKAIQKRLGLDVVGVTTFGALSQGELDLALQVALPTDLNDRELSKWVGDKIAAQIKLRGVIEEFAVFTGRGDKTIADWIDHKNALKAEPDDEISALEQELGLN